MDVRCALGWHAWKPVVRHSKHKVAQYRGGAFFVCPVLTHWPTVGHQCRRCGARTSP